MISATMMHHPVTKVGREHLPRLRAVGDETDRTTGLVRVLAQLVLQGQHTALYPAGRSRPIELMTGIRACFALRNDGMIGVTYYDFRNDTNDGRELTDYWAISCDIAAGANCRAVSGWGGEQRLTLSSFDMLDAPVARGHFLGDYQGLVKAGSSVKAVFGKAVSDNVNDMFLSTIP